MALLMGAAAAVVADAADEVEIAARMGAALEVQTIA